ncbi:unnamed protein product [Mortierella alpina]
MFHRQNASFRNSTPELLSTLELLEYTRLKPDWFVHDKPLTKFGTLPILHEISADCKTVIEHAEALAIELRLARRFNLLGANAFEESQIMSFFSNTRAIMHRHEDVKVLKENGSTGFYIGDKVTLAEIKTAVAVDQLLNGLYVFKGFEGIKKLITPELTPNPWKVRENVLQKKSYKDRLGSPVFQEFKDGTTELFDIKYSQQ